MIEVLSSATLLMFGISNTMRDIGIGSSREYPGRPSEVKELSIARPE
ncbi:hypothetical protein OG417_23805 [Actinoallomurus sp. NBC_01490]|nr:hypothetical protein [Actinoallomurus sp. NBC_01490]